MLAPVAHTAIPVQADTDATLIDLWLHGRGGQPRNVRLANTSND